MVANKGSLIIIALESLDCASYLKYLKLHIGVVIRHNIVSVNCYLLIKVVVFRQLLNYYGFFIYNFSMSIEIQIDF